MREILFKGKRADNGEWVLSVNLIQKYHNETKKVYFPKAIETSCCVEVIHETVGQYIGLTDKNGKKIFEGDIVRDEQSGYECFIKWFPEYACFGLANNSGHMEDDVDEFVMSLNDLIVIGNIHDNSEYMEVPE